MQFSVSKRVLTTIICSSLLLGACQTTRQAGDPEGPIIYVKDGMTGESALSDYEACSNLARNAPYERVSTAGSGGGGLIGAIAAAAVAGMINGMRQAEARNKAWNGCMNSRQYHKVEVPDDVLADFKDADETSEKAAVLDAWIVSPAYEPITAWFSVEKTNDPIALRGFLTDYPNSSFRYAALTQASSLDGGELPLQSVRAEAVLISRFRSLNGLNKLGWSYAGNGGSQGPIQCGSDTKADMVLSIQDGIIEGHLRSRTLPNRALKGTIGEDGTVQFSASWPTDDPLSFEGTYNAAGLIEGVLSSEQNAGCDQAIWFEVLQTPEGTVATGDTVVNAALSGDGEHGFTGKLAIVLEGSGGGNISSNACTEGQSTELIVSVIDGVGSKGIVDDHSTRISVSLTHEKARIQVSDVYGTNVQTVSVHLDEDGRGATDYQIIGGTATTYTCNGHLSVRRAGTERIIPTQPVEILAEEDEVVDAEALLPEEDLPPPPPPEPTILWTGSAVGDGKGPYYHHFCESTEENTLSIEVTGTTIKGTLVREFDGKTVPITGKLDGTAVRGVLNDEGRETPHNPKESFGFYITGSVDGDVITGTLSRPGLRSCAATFNLTRQESDL